LEAELKRALGPDFWRSQGPERGPAEGRSRLGQTGCHTGKSL